MFFLSNFWLLICEFCMFYTNISHFPSSYEHMSLEAHLKSLGIPKEYEFQAPKDIPVNIDYVNGKFLIFSKEGILVFLVVISQITRFSTSKNVFSNAGRVNFDVSWRRRKSFAAFYSPSRASGCSLSIRWVRFHTENLF